MTAYYSIGGYQKLGDGEIDTLDIRDKKISIGHH